MHACAAPRLFAIVHAHMNYINSRSLNKVGVVRAWSIVFKKLAPV